MAIITELTFNGISSNYGFIGDKIIGGYSPVSFSLKPSHPIVIVSGNNGAGKTSLLRTIINKEVVNVVGNFTIKTDNSNLNISEDIRKFYKKKIKTLYIPQGIIDMFPRENCVYTVVKSWAQIGKVKDFKSLLTTAGLLADYEEMKFTHCGRISLGQAHILALIITTVYQPDLLLVDEPTASASSENKPRIISFFKELAKSGKLLIIASHDQELKMIIHDPNSGIAVQPNDLNGTFVEIVKQ